MFDCSSNLDMHPNDVAKYWNDQGYEYLKGTNKDYSTEDAKRCFLKAYQMGDKIAILNLVESEKYGFFSLGDLESEIKENYTRYKPQLDIWSKSDNYNEMMRALEIRHDLESTLEFILCEKYKELPKIGRAKLAIDLAFKEGYVNRGEKDILHNIRMWEGPRLHHDPVINDDIEYREHWSLFLKNLRVNFQKNNQ